MAAAARRLAHGWGRRGAGGRDDGELGTAATERWGWGVRRRRPSETGAGGDGELGAGGDGEMGMGMGSETRRSGTARGCPSPL